MGAGESVVKAETSTQTESTEGNSETRRHKTSLGVKDYPKELLDYTPGKKDFFSISLFERLSLSVFYFCARSPSSNLSVLFRSVVLFR